MNISLSLIQFLFIFVCILFSMSFATHYFEQGFDWINISLGFVVGCILSAILIGIERILRKFQLRSLNTALLGLFFGCLMAQVILLNLEGVLAANIDSASFLPVRFFIFLICAYIGIVMTIQSADEIHLSIPFVEFKKLNQKRKDSLLDTSILNDSRIIDLASTGLLDQQLVIPRFAVKELYTQAASSDEAISGKAKRSLETIRKLDNIPSLELRYIDTDFPEIKDPMNKLVFLARFLDTNIITSDINRIQQPSIDGMKIINLHMLSNTIKSTIQAGETITIKIQRYGKEARQGIGYLEDGTMVVVNGGAEFIGETIKAHVLSLKRTTSGQMIFCNAAEEGSLLTDQEREFCLSSSSDDPKNFLTL